MIINNSDAIALQEDFLKSKKTELKRLKLRCLWNVVDKTNVCVGERIIGGRFIMSSKNYRAPDETAKMRFIARGFSDRDKPYVLHDTFTLRTASIKIIIFVTAIKRFSMILHEVTQAYLQIKYELSQMVFTGPKRKDPHLFGIIEGQLWKLVKHFYGLCEAGEY